MRTSMRWAVVAAGVLVASCGSSRVPVVLPAAFESFPLRVEWDSIRADSVSGTEAVVEALERFRREHGALFAFWIPDSLSDSLAATVAVFEHPCGGSTAAFVKRLPPSGTTVSGEWMFEVDSAGNVLTRWPVPIDRVPAGVRGAELLLIERHPRVLVAVRPSGKFRFVSGTEAMNAAPTACPAIEEFHGSAYSRCEYYTDGERRRLIAFQGPCT